MIRNVLVLEETDVPSTRYEDKPYKGWCDPRSVKRRPLLETLDPATTATRKIEESVSEKLMVLLSGQVIPKPLYPIMTCPCSHRVFFVLDLSDDPEDSPSWSLVFRWVQVPIDAPVRRDEETCGFPRTKEGRSNERGGGLESQIYTVREVGRGARTSDWVRDSVLGRTRSSFGGTLVTNRKRRTVGEGEEVKRKSLGERWVGQRPEGYPGRGRDWDLIRTLVPTLLVSGRTWWHSHKVG